MPKKNIEHHLLAQRIVGSFFLAIVALTLYGSQHSPVAAALSQGERVVTILFGIDAADASQHTDTLMVASFDPLQNKVGLLSIPRDTRIRLPGFLFRRVNEIYGYHLRKSKDPYFSAREVRKGIEYLLSSDSFQLLIPHFVQVDYSGFTKLVDILGGVWVTVKNPMHYDDYAGNYHFHRDPGRYLLDGKEALFYVRFRGSTGDRGRIFRQQEFLRTMAKKMANPINVLKFPRMVSAVAASVTTDFNFWDVCFLAASARRVRSNDISFYILPGRPQGPYWIPNSNLVTPFAAHVLYGNVLDAPDLKPIVPQTDLITISVWNASGKPQMAYRVTRFLRQCGYDVVEWNTYATEQIPTRVIDRRGKILQAHEVASQLGVENIHSEPNSKIMVDVEVVIGRDFEPSFKLEE